MTYNHEQGVVTAQTQPQPPGLPERRVSMFAIRQLFRFAWLEVRCCAFAVALFAGLAVSSMLSLPIARYDALMLYGVAVSLVFWLAGWETGREVGLIAVFHVIGLLFELVKVRMGSWSYPEPALFKIASVPLYSGFLYAAVGSYVCRAWRVFELRLFGYRALPTTLAAVAIYVNFITHYWLPDLRWVLAALLLAATWGVFVHFTAGSVRYRMPLALSFVLIGFFLWGAENVATFFGAWRYPDQLNVWRLVHPSKFGAWSLLVSVAFVVVATAKARSGQLHHLQRPQLAGTSSSTSGVAEDGPGRGQPGWPGIGVGGIAGWVPGARA